VLGIYVVCAAQPTVDEAVDPSIVDAEEAERFGVQFLQILWEMRLIQEASQVGGVREQIVS